MVLGQFPPEENFLSDNSPPDNCTQIIAPRTFPPEDNCPQGKLTPGQLPPRIITPGKLPPHYKISPENNCPRLSKFPSKSNTSELRKTMHCLRVLYLKNHSTKSYFSRLQLTSKKWFTSIYFLQILTKPCIAPFLREHLSLNASWFSYPRTQQKDKIFWKNWFRKKSKQTS